MAYPLALAIPIRAGAITFGLIFVVIAGGALIGLLRRPRGKTLASLAGESIGAIIVLAIPTAVFTLLGIVAVAILVTLRLPPLAYLFLSVAGLVMLDAARRAPSGGMEGCNKLIGLFGSTYLAICGGVAFWMSGGSEVWREELASLRWLQPAIAALPLAVAAARFGRKDPVRLFFRTWGFLSAPFALLFFPVEEGVAAAWLPRADWLRFPLAGAAAGAALGLLHLLAALGMQGRKVRGRDVRRLIGTSLLYALVGVVAGLVWAAARTVVAAI
jgi:hypothetical protein